MRDGFGRTLTAEEADREAKHCEELINERNWNSSPYDQDKLASLRKRRDEARAHAQAIRDAEREEAERKEATAQADDDALLATAEARMAMYRDEIEDDRDACDRLAVLVDDLRRAHAGLMAQDQLGKLQRKVADAAERRGVKPPKAPKIEPLPGSMRLVLRRLDVPERVVREESARLERQSRDLATPA